MMRGVVTSDLQAFTHQSERDLEQIMERAMLVKEGLTRMQGLMVCLEPYTPIALPLSLNEDQPDSPSAARGKVKLKNIFFYNHFFTMALSGPMR